MTRSHEENGIGHKKRIWRHNEAAGMAKNILKSYISELQMNEVKEGM